MGDTLIGIEEKLEKLIEEGKLLKIRFVGSKLLPDEVGQVVKQLTTRHAIQSLQIIICEINPQDLSMFFNELHNTALVILKLINVGITNEHMKEMAASVFKRAESKSAGLRKIEFAFNDIGPTGIKALMDVYSSPVGKDVHLEQLFLGRNKIGDEGCLHIAGALSSIHGKTKILAIDLRMNGITDTGVQYLLPKLKESTLLYLDLSQNLLTLECIVELCEYLPYTGLVRLGLGGYAAGDILVEHLIKAIKASRLTSLDVSGNQITDKGGILIAKEIKRNIRFKNISMKNNLLTEDTAKALLKAIHAHVSMCFVDVSENHGIGDEKRKEIAAVLGSLHTPKTESLTAMCSVKYVSRICSSTTKLTLLPVDIIRKLKGFVDGKWKEEEEEEE